MRYANCLIVGLLAGLLGVLFVALVGMFVCMLNVVSCSGFGLGLLCICLFVVWLLGVLFDNSVACLFCSFCVGLLIVFDVLCFCGFIIDRCGCLLGVCCLLIVDVYCYWFGLVCVLVMLDCVFVCFVRL